MARVTTQDDPTASDHDIINELVPSSPLVADSMQVLLDDTNEEEEEEEEEDPNPDGLPWCNSCDAYVDSICPECEYCEGCCDNSCFDESLFQCAECELHFKPVDKAPSISSVYCKECYYGGDYDQTPYDEDGNPLHDDSNGDSNIIRRRGGTPLWADAAWYSNKFVTYYAELVNSGDRGTRRACASWGIDARINPGIEMARFYLAEALIHGVLFDGHPEIRNDRRLRWIADDATRIQQQVIDRCDSTFLGYAQMACWGEFRHNSRLWDSTYYADHGKGDRTTAWIAAKQFATNAPPDTFTQMAAMFREMGSGSIGGERWAIACELTYLRLVGKLSPLLWCDRIFNLQHNGGLFLNKISWGGSETDSLPDYPTIWYDEYDEASAETIVGQVGTAHAADQPDLRFLAEIGGHSAFLDQAVRAVRQVQREWGIRPTPLQRIPDLHISTDRASFAATEEFRRAGRDDRLRRIALVQGVHNTLVRLHPWDDAQWVSTDGRVYYWQPNVGWCSAAQMMTTFKRPIPPLAPAPADSQAVKTQQKYPDDYPLPTKEANSDSENPVCV